VRPDLRHLAVRLRPQDRRDVGRLAEQALLSAGCAQMFHFYDFTGGTASA
jgi:hypothetical protein